jgi:hypothetical protein
MSASATKAASPTIDTFGLCLGEPHPELDEVQRLGGHFGVYVEFVAGSGYMWRFSGFNRVTEYFPNKRVIRLTGPQERTGDYAIAIMATLTGCGPLTAADHRLCNTIRSYMPPSAQ